MAAPLIPDPSQATIAFVERITHHRAEILDAKITAAEHQLSTIAAAHKDLVDQQIATVQAEALGGRPVLTARLDAMDTAATTLAETVNRVPTQLQIAVAQIKELQDVKFGAIGDRFDLLDKQTVREKAAADLALAAAFNAQKEASAAQNYANSESVRKSEATTAETIKTNAEVVRTGQASTNDKIEDVKDRMSRLEAMIIAIQTERSTVQTGRSDSKVTWQVALVAIGTLIAVVVAAVTIYAALKP